jgi:hypothetical protein
MERDRDACRFTVPPAVALLNNISCVILWRYIHEFEPKWIKKGRSRRRRIAPTRRIRRDKKRRIRREE